MKATPGVDPAMTNDTRSPRTYCPYCGLHYPAGAAHNCLEKTLGYPPRSTAHDPGVCNLCRGVKE